MASTRGHGVVPETGELLIFDHAAIDRIETAADRSFLDMLEEVERVVKEGRRPRVGLLAYLLWGAHLAARPGFTLDEANAMVLAGDEPRLKAMSEALAEVMPRRGDLPAKEAGADASAGPPNRKARRARKAATGS
jgi:hypothetical protein